jgi:Ca2+/Na+ antiporter
MGKVITIEFDAKSVEMRDRWVMAIKLGMHSLARNREETAISVTSYAETAITFNHGHAVAGKIPAWMELVDWFKFPVQFSLRLTIPNVKDEKYRSCMPLSFAMSMFWLALFAFCVVSVCDIISYEFDIPVTVLGFTVAAIGTSFPNVISCIAVSRQGKTAMAIANALGANIQNVFIALALPWFCKSAAVGSFKVGTNNLVPSILAMVVTLALLVLVVIMVGCKMPKWAGMSFLGMYVIYLVLSLGQEFGCETWPFCS